MIFALGAGYELWHLVAARRFGTLAMPLSAIVALVHMLVWGAAAVLLVLRDRVSDRMLRASFGLSAVGAFLMLAHGLVLRGLLYQPMGIAFIVGGVVVALLVKLAWTPFPWTAGDRAAAAPPHPIVRGPDGQEHELL